MVITYDKNYHIYNRGNNKRPIFNSEVDVSKFLWYYKIFITPVADTFAWCVMKNHFHFFIRIKNQDEIGYFNPQYSQSKNIEEKWMVFEKDFELFTVKKQPVPFQQFKHFFNLFSKWYNIEHYSTGSLFEKNYEKREIIDESEFINLIVYINNNPVKHKVVSQPEDYNWSSYNEVIKNQYSLTNQHIIQGLFSDKDKFIREHKQRIKYNLDIKE
jgi:REP element-mobilizing transposase RayT